MFYFEHWYLDAIAMITSFMTALTCSFFYSKILIPKKESKFYIFKYLLFLYGVYLVCRVIPFLYINRALIMLISYFVAMCLFSKEKLGKKILITILTHIFLILIDMPTSMVTLSKYGYTVSQVNAMSNEEYFILYDLIYKDPNSLALTALNNVILCFLFINLMMILKKETRHIMIWLVYLLITVLFTTVAMMSYYYLNTLFSIILLLSSSSVVIILLFYFVNKLKIYTKYDEYKNENKFLKEKEKMQYEYYEMVRSREENVRRINHDIKNNLQVMYKLNDEKERLKLIEDINDSLDKYSLVKYSTQDILNVILNLKVKEAKTNNIDIDVSIKNNLTFMESIDISNLITNILDNAIRGSNKSKEKFIKFNIKKKMNYIIIDCSNSYSEKIILNKKNELISTKNNNHGYGTKIIKEVVNKYNGNISYDIKNDIFNLTIMIEITEK